MKKVTRTDIQLLWQQAGGDSFDEESFYDEVVQRFAKLIAKQCADIVDVGDGQMCSMAETVWCNACRDYIKIAVEACDETT